MMRLIRVLAVIVVLAFLAFAAGQAHAQVATGTPPFGSFGGGPDIINLGSLNSHITIPIFHKAGRGLNFNYDLSYDSSVWTPVSGGTWTPSGTWGWTNSMSNVGYLVYSGTITTGTCTGTNGRPGRTTAVTYHWTYLDGMGSPHYFPVPSGTSSNGCTGQNSQSGFVNQVASDGSGYSLTATGTSYTVLKGATGSVIGVVVNSTHGAATIQDRNGNEITATSGGVYTDTLGTTALTVAGTGTPSSPITLTYTAPGGATHYAVNYTTYTIQTKFGCGGIIEYGANGTTTANLVSEIDLPDGSKYLFGYEMTPGDTHTPHFVTGRLASVQLPEGGTISYSYTGGNNGINCADGSAATLTRGTTPGGTWSYARSQVSGTHWQTQITTPANDTTMLQFQQSGIYSYETQRLTYQGSTSGTLLQTLTTCYNGNTTNCPTTAVTQPITQRNVSPQFGSTGRQALQIYKYNNYGLPIEEDDYDYASGAPSNILRKIFTNYASLGNGIVSMPATVTVCTASGTNASCGGAGTPVAQTTYTYDQGTPTVSSGTPQHISITGARGNATTIASLVSGSTTLSKTSTYYDTGMINAATDVNNAVTTYSYAGTSCGNSFPTGVTEAISTLSKSFAWDCTGGVLTQVTDENGQNTTTNYSDAFFWRPHTVTDASGAVTTYSYPTGSPFNWVESSLPIVSGTSVADSRTTLDGLGRPILQQRRQGPSASNYDTVETDYDSLGRVNKVTLPFSTTAGATNSSAAGTTTQYDALSRVKNSTDSGNGTTSYTYTNNDVLVAVGPAPTGENLKQRQLEYDGLGRLASVCEITSAIQSGSCAQALAATGYWTKYSYDVLGDLTGVTQNAQPNGSPQTRTYAYDGLGRKTSETNPESGTTSYVYDTATGCTGTYSGDLVKKADAVGNTSCYVYDLLHRATSITYTGPYANATPIKHFMYDTATVNGITMVKAKGRLAEAYTCSGSCTAKTTDLGFSYTSRGEMSDEYQSSPNSGGYYHAAFQYWPHGAAKQLSGLVTLPTFTYGVDTEGRTNTVSASTGQNPVTAATYNLNSNNNPPQISVTYGSADSDVFTFDPNTLRETKYQFNVNNQAFIGTLGWNANGTLSSLAITDPFNSADGQSCSYVHDDLVRLSSANCGSAASQTFTYDPFGNINKTGSPYSFQAAYSSSTNRMTSIGGSFTPTYDNNGNELNDGDHTYTWDADGRHATVIGVSVTYDALGRMVENGNPSEYVYLPDGSSVLFKGQVARRGWFNLPGGGNAIYDSAQGGLINYNHPDHLGSARLESSPSRAFISSQAYAPFGEPYALSPGAGGFIFTGQTQQFDLDIYDFPARQYSDRGRWVSPDPAGLAAVDATNPQSWNRYAYVVNNPLGLTDPLGLYYVDCIWTGNCLGLQGGAGGGYYGGGPGGCSLDGVQTACGNLTGLGSNGIAPCPGNYCGPYTGNNGALYTFRGTVEGGAFVNPLNGELFTDGSELGLPDLGDSYPFPNSSTGQGGSNSGGGPSCQQNRILNLIPGATLTSYDTNQGGHEQIGINTTAAGLAAAGFAPFSLLGANGYRNGSMFWSIHVNGQYGAQLTGNGPFTDIQAHIDLFNPATGLLGIVGHGIWDLGVGSLLFNRSNALDPRCH